MVRSYRNFKMLSRKKYGTSGELLPLDLDNRGPDINSANIYFYFILFYLFIYFWLPWVFVAARGLSLVAGSGGYSSLWCTGFSLWWLLLLRSTGSRRAGSVVVTRGL